MRNGGRAGGAAGRATVPPNVKHSVSGAAYAGYLYIAASAILWGISATLGRAAFTGRLLPNSEIRNIDPVILSQCRTSFSFLAVAGWLLPARGWKRLTVPRADLARLFVIGLAGVAASNYFYYLAIQKTSVATAIIVQYTAPVWVLVYMILRGAERPTISKMASIVLAITGIALVIGLFGQGRLQLDPVGITAALIAAFSFAFYNVGGHYILIRYDRWTVLLYTTMAASLFWIVINPPTRIVAAHYSFVAWLFLIVFAMVSVLVPFAFYFAGLQRLDPTKAIIVSCLEPVFSILIAAAALREVIRPLQALGVLMVLSAIVVVQRPTRGELAPPLAGPVD
jgi:drug/metabolite transporter (DMT)-like permease